MRRARAGERRRSAGRADRNEAARHPEHHGAGATAGRERRGTTGAAGGAARDAESGGPKRAVSAEAEGRGAREGETAETDRAVPLRGQD